MSCVGMELLKGALLFKLFGGEMVSVSLKSTEDKSKH